MDFRKILSKIEEENIRFKVENASLKAYHTHQDKKFLALQSHLDKSEAQMDSLLHKVNNANDKIRSLLQGMQDKDMALNKTLTEKQRVKQKYNSKIQAEMEKLNKELELRIQEDEHLQEKEEKIKSVKKILDEKNDFNSDSSVSKYPIPIQLSEAGDNLSVKTSECTDCQSRRTKIAIVNSRYRRSQSVDKCKDHRPEALVPVGTVLQPLMRKQKSITELTSPKGIAGGAFRYCLVTQEQDSEGELETKLYKGDIVPTSEGGAQVFSMTLIILNRLPQLVGNEVNLQPQEAIILNRTLSSVSKTSLFLKNLEYKLKV